MGQPLSCFPSIIAGYLEQGLMVKDPKKLRKNYFNSKYFIFDVLSILPTDLTYLAWSSTCDKRLMNSLFPDNSKILIILGPFFTIEKSVSISANA